MRKTAEQRRRERMGQKHREKASPKCPNCGQVLSPDHVCPSVEEDMQLLEETEKAAVAWDAGAKFDTVSDEKPEPEKVPVRMGLRARVRQGSQVTPVKVKPTLAGPKAKLPKYDPYEHVTQEAYIHVEGFDSVTVKVVTSVPGLAYFFSSSVGAWYLVHLPSRKVMATTVRDEYIIERVCARFRYVDWTKPQGWFQTKLGKQIQADLKEYVDALHDGKDIKKKFSSEFELTKGEEMTEKPNTHTPLKTNTEEDEFDLLGEAMAGTPKSTEDVEDELDYPVAYRLAWLGIGHAGNRLVETAYKIGYRRVLAVNTSRQDLDELDLPEDMKICLGGKGAGKVREVGNELVNDRYEEIMEAARKHFGQNYDRVFVCASAGGGTGSGGFPACVDCANELMQAQRLKPKVGVILALPLKSEKGQFDNAKSAMHDLEVMLSEDGISPVVLLDNERIRHIFPTVTMGKLWPTANQSVIALLHYFNRLTVQSGNKYENCDPADFGTVLDSGVIGCGQMAIGSTEKGELASAFRDNLKQNLLMGGFDYSKSKKVVCLVAGPEEVIDEIPALHLDHAFESLSRATGGAPVHRGIYAFGKSLRALTMVGGLNIPKDWSE